MIRVSKYLGILRYMRMNFHHKNSGRLSEMLFNSNMNKD